MQAHQGISYFPPVIDYNTGNTNFPIVAGDLDSDGNPDMISFIDGVPAVYRNLLLIGPAIHADSTIATCNLDNGTITLSGTGGTSPLQYSLDNNAFQSNGNFTSLAGKTYKAMVSDVNGCLDSVNVIIRQTGKPSIKATSVDAGCQANDGVITVSAIGGVGTYLFSKDNFAYQTSGVFNALVPQLYDVSVKDSAGCISDTSITILSKCISLSATFVPDTCNKSLGKINSSASLGVPPYQYSLDAANFQDTGLFAGLIAGGYTVMVKDADGVAANADVVVGNIGLPVTVNAGADLNICKGDSMQLNASSDGTDIIWSRLIF